MLNFSGLTLKASEEKETLQFDKHRLSPLHTFQGKKHFQREFFCVLCNYLKSELGQIRTYKYFQLDFFEVVCFDA